MPELPEVEVLVRHLEPLLRNKKVRGVQVLRAKVLAPTSTAKFSRTLQGTKFASLVRRGKYLVFTLRCGAQREPVKLVGHLGMTGRMYLLPAKAVLPKHAAVVLDLGRTRFVFEDTRYFGRLTLDTQALARLGPEPLDEKFTVEEFGAALKLSGQAIKVKLLDQSLVAGVGKNYFKENLFITGIFPRVWGRRLRPAPPRRVWEEG